MKNKKQKIKLRSFDELAIEHFKKDKKLADAFLNNALKEYQKDNDERVLLVALRQVAMASGGFQELSKKTGLSRESLYKTLSMNGNPKFQTLKIILENLGYIFTIKKIKSV
ncbi:MAG: putative addiction module antidote protein [Rickettsiales bacterium]|nr:putative addiction module antidote protein [Rickettsiales bacterium]